MNILEAYDFVICSICCGNSSGTFLNIFDNFIGYNSRFFSLADVIKDSLNMEVSMNGEIKDLFFDSFMTA